MSYKVFDLILNPFIATDRENSDTSKWVIESNGDKYGETRIGATKAYCVVDFLYPEGNKVVIMNWKTGSPSTTHRKQLLGYVLPLKTNSL